MSIRACSPNHCTWASLARLVPLLILCTLSACGGGGGSTGGGGTTGQPTIIATVITFPTGGSPPGFVADGYNSAALVKVTDQTSGASITTASVTVNSTSLIYLAAEQAYEAALNLNPGDTVKVTVSVNGATYSAVHDNFSTYPTITAPVADTTWSSQATNLVSWSGAVPDATSQYALGVFDTSGALIWPTGGNFAAVPPTDNSYSIAAGNVTPGSRLVLVGIIDAAGFPGAASGSGLAMGGFSYAAVTIKTTTAAVESVAVSPASVTVGIGRSTQLAATATYSDGSTQDVTAQANWSSSSTQSVTVSGTGVVSGAGPGTATITAQYSGFSGSTAVAVFQPNPSPIPPLSQAVTYQMDYAHSGRGTVGGSGPIFPPTAHWATTLNGSSISYPLIAAGKVYVTTNATPADALYGTTLYAIDETTGSVVWGPTPLSGTYSFSGAAYDHGTLFVVNFDGLLRTFDAATGTPGWSKQLFGQDEVTSPPTAVNGIVYVNGSGGLMAIDETNGNVMWTGTGGSDHSSPAVSTDGVFVSGPCDVYKSDPIVGTVLWHFAEACSGGGGKTAAYANNSVYARDLFNTSSSQNVNLTLDAATGKQLGSFTSLVIPAFSDKDVFFLASGTVTAADLSTGTTLWTFAGDGMLVSAPIVIDNVVVVGSSSGTVYALNISNGNVLWSGPAGAAIAAPDEQNATLLTGLGAGDGYLVVPAGNILNGWRIVQ